MNTDARITRLYTSHLVKIGQNAPIFQKQDKASNCKILQMLIMMHARCGMLWNVSKRKAVKMCRPSVHPTNVCRIKAERSNWLEWYEYVGYSSQERTKCRGLKQAATNSTHEAGRPTLRSLNNIEQIIRQRGNDWQTHRGQLGQVSELT